MASKLHPGEFDCYAAALPDEPLFILLARDKSAPAIIRGWVQERRTALLQERADNPELESDPIFMERYHEDLNKCREAEMCAHDMQVWRNANDGVWREDSQRTKALDEINPAFKESIADALKRALVNELMCGSAELSIVEHRVNNWSRPGFNIRRHYFRVESVEKFGQLEGELHPALEEFQLSGWDAELGDVLCKYKSASDIRLEIQIIGG